MCVALLVHARGALADCGARADALALLFGGAALAPPAAKLIEQARRFADPYHVARSSGGARDVVEFQSGPLGVLLRQHPSRELIVSQYQGGEASAAYRSGKVRVGDTLFAVNGLSVRRGATAQEFAGLLKQVGRPVFVAFRHATEHELAADRATVAAHAAAPQAFAPPPSGAAVVADAGAGA